MKKLKLLTLILTLILLKHQLIYISIIVVVVSIFVAVGIGYLISKPIKRINDSAKLLASGEREIRFEGKGYQEIDDLNNTLNYAVAELKKTEKLQKNIDCMLSWLCYPSNIC